MASWRPFAVVTGASSGTGYHLARLCAEHGHDRLIADDQPKIGVAAEVFRRLGREMRARGQGRILLTGSVAGFIPGTFQAVYNGTKAVIDAFSFALRNELKDSGVTVSCLMQGTTDTGFFARADMLDTKVGADSRADPVDVAKAGFDAMMKGEGDVVAGLKNKLQVAAAHLTPNAVLAEQHRKLAEPGSARN